MAVTSANNRCFRNSSWVHGFLYCSLSFFLCSGVGGTVAKFARFNGISPFRMATLVAQSLATSTRKTYAKLWDDFVSIAFAFGISPLPISSEHLEAILQYFASWKKSVSLVNSLLSAVSHAHAVAGYSSVATSPRIKLLLRGVTREYGRPAKPCCPLTADLVKGAIGLLEQDHLRTTNFEKPLLLWRSVAMMVLSFASLARFDCMTKLKLTNMHFLASGMEIFFPSSKTDQARKGEVVFIARVEHTSTCPVLFMRAYYVRLHWDAFQRGAFPFVGHLFPALQRRNGSSWPTNRPASRQACSKGLRDTLSLLGVPDTSLFTLHSGRRGGATAAAMNGCSLLSIKRQGRWRTDSCPQRYIDDAISRKNNFSRFLGL